VSSALTGIAVLRMYFACSPDALSSAARLKASESFGFVAIAAVLILAGLAPAPLVLSRQQASERLFGERVTNAVRSTR